MRHVGRIDPETGLPITEVTQAEFDALPVLKPEQWPLTDLPWRGTVAGFYRPDEPMRWSLSYLGSDDRIVRRRLVIVENSSPKVPYPSKSNSRSTSVSAGSASSAGLSVVEGSG